ncbi:MAG TPA: EamA family transporter [Gammaproteobacteria bacterium]|nr:EamA family transporter [Gammaproteobacteria bacterium]
MSAEHAHASPGRIALGFAAVYILWGSTYLGIRFAVASIPPLLMAGTRFFAAGCILYALVRRRGAARPTFTHWRSAVILGGLLLLGGNGLVSIAEQTVPSGIAALIVAAVPFWMVLLNAAEQRTQPKLSVIAGLVLGIVGLAVLVLPGNSAGHADPLGVGLLLAASFSWAVGSLYAPRAHLPASTFLGIAMEMVAGGVLLWIVGLATGESVTLHANGITLKSALALAYLTVFGSLLGFSAYVWLLKVTTPARASTYAFVNPVIAVILGWALAGEMLDARILLAGAVIVAAVCIIMYFGAAKGIKAGATQPVEAGEG